MKKAIGIDIGSANVRLAVAGLETKIYSEPAVVAVSRDDGRKVIACGNDANYLWSRIPGGVKLVHPFTGETAPDPLYSEALIRYIIGKGRLRSPDAYLSYSGKHTKEAEKIVVDAAQKGGAGDVISVDPSYAAACGCGYRGMGENIIANIGAAVCDIAAYSHSKLAELRTCGYAGRAVDKSIGTGIFHKYRFSITPDTAESIKLSFVSLTKPADTPFVIPVTKPTVGLPCRLSLTPSEVSGFAEKVTDELIDEIVDVVRNMPAEPDKIVLTGGGAKLNGLPAALESIVRLPVVVANEPENAVIRGIIHIIDSDEG